MHRQSVSDEPWTRGELRGVIEAGRESVREQWQTAFICSLVRRKRMRGRYDLCKCGCQLLRRGIEMSKLLRGVAAGYGAKKLGGGCFSTVLIFILLWWLLGHFGVFK